MEVTMFLIELVSDEIESLLCEQDYCNCVDRYEQIESELKVLEFVEEELYNELDYEY